MSYFPVECIANEKVFAQIKRFDSKFYNPISKKFEDNPNLIIELFPDGEVWSPSPKIEQDSIQFTPGRYTVYYSNISKICGASYEYIDVLPPTSTDIAVRIAGIQTVDGNLKASINKMSKQLSAIEKYLGLPATKA